MLIKKLLFVTKFDELSYDALDSLLDLRQVDLEHVVFMYVIERDKIAMHRGTGYEKQKEIRLKETANIRFIDWAENLFEQGMEVGVYLKVGTLVSEVIRASEKEDADLIVIGRSQKGVLSQLYEGSEIIELLRRSKRPVLVYKHLADEPFIRAKPFERPLMAVDWSPASLRCTAYLKRMKKIIKEVHVIHVANEKELEGDSAMSIQKFRKTTRAKLDQISDEFEKEGIKAIPHIYIGDTEDEIEKAAKECQATMIVLGSSAKPGWQERWVGSTPRTIAEKSPFPTLLIPPERN